VRRKPGRGAGRCPIIAANECLNPSLVVVCPATAHGLREARARTDQQIRITRLLDTARAVAAGTDRTRKNHAGRDPSSCSQPSGTSASSSPAGIWFGGMLVMSVIVVIVLCMVTFIDNLLPAVRVRRSDYTIPGTNSDRGQPSPGSGQVILFGRSYTHGLEIGTGVSVA
jgi:hypothetical protein